MHSRSVLQGEPAGPLAPFCASEILKKTSISSCRYKKEAVTSFPFSGALPFAAPRRTRTFVLPVFTQKVPGSLCTKGAPSVGQKAFAWMEPEKNTASHALRPSAPPFDSEYGPSSLPSSTASSCLDSYRGCLTSIFIFCFGVRSPCRMTAITQRSSILGKHKIQLTNVPLHSRTATRK